MILRDAFLIKGKNTDIQYLDELSGYQIPAQINHCHQGGTSTYFSTLGGIVVILKMPYITVYNRIYEIGKTHLLCTKGIYYKQCIDTLRYVYHL